MAATGRRSRGPGGRKLTGGAASEAGGWSGVMASRVLVGGRAVETTRSLQETGWAPAPSRGFEGNPHWSRPGGGRTRKPHGNSMSYSCLPRLTVYLTSDLSFSEYFGSILT